MKFKYVKYISSQMEQAFNNFNSGKYKQAYNQLNSANINTESYEPNLAICEYLNNGRTLNASHVCIRKLNTLIAKKNKKDGELYDQMTLQLMKYNIGILMLLNGKKENAYLLISDVYTHQKCFIDFLKYRMLLLLMELNISLKKNVQALKLFSKYISNPCESKPNSNQWISLLFHEHSRSSAILKEELDFIMGIFVSQAMMQLGLPQSCLPTDEERQQVLEILLEKARKRKNNANKYYQLNLQLIDRFYQAQKQFHQSNREKAIELLYFANIQSDLEKMPQNKIITNIYSSLSYNNIGIIHFSYGKPCVALNYFNKAQTILYKGCTGVQDKDLQLFSSNYSSHGHKIFYNMGVVALNSYPTQAYQILNQLKKSSTQCCDYKYWYRIGQAQLEHFHESYSKMPRENREIILQSALKSFNQSLLALSKRQIPSLSISKALPILKEEQIEAMIMKMKGEVQAFRQSITLIICYICLHLNQYHKVIRHGKQLLENQKTQDTTRLHALQYMMEAYTRLERHKNALKCINDAEKLNKSYKKVGTNTNYFKRNQIVKEKMEMDSVIAYQTAVLKIKQNSLNEAHTILEKENAKKSVKHGQAFKILGAYLQRKIT